MNLTPLPLDPRIRSRFLQHINSLDMHILEGGYETLGQPTLLLLHGFPETAYSWRKQMVPLSEAGFHVIAPDLRGYGRTTGWHADPFADPSDFNFLNLTIDLLSLLAALGKEHVDAVIGHDFGSPLAAIAALIRPDKFKSVVMMSAPFSGVPSWQSGDSTSVKADGFELMLSAVNELAKLDPPRQHYHWYYSSPEANADMHHPPEGLHAFLRAYYHMKSADWEPNQPYPLLETSALTLAQLPHYYVMEHGKTMPENVATAMPDKEAISHCHWLPDDELAVYAAEFERTGFQGGLQWYRCLTSREQMNSLRLLADLTIDVPSCFIAGERDWGVYQTPGAFDKMQQKACTQMLGCHLVADAGHWVQQEQPEVVLHHIFNFFKQAGILFNS